MARAPKVEEEVPPHDALEGVVLPRANSTLIGHAAAERTLLDAYRSHRMHHAWILSGERGIGKATLAFRFARFIFANPDPSSKAVVTATDLSVSDDDPAARKVAAGTHANLLHLQREWDFKSKRHKTALSVESVRRVIPLLGQTAGEGGWRVVIVDPADDMTPSAANAILKNLEEPPRQTLFLLTAERRGALLPTILSRCRMLDLKELSDEDTEAVAREVASELADPAEGKLAALLAAGSPRQLIELRQGGGVEMYRLMVDAIEQSDRQAQLKLSAAASGLETSRRFVGLFDQYLLRRVRSWPEPLRGAKPRSAPLVTWAELWEKAAKSWQEVEEYNLDRRQFVLDLLETAAAVGRPAAAS